MSAQKFIKKKAKTGEKKLKPTKKVEAAVEVKKEKKEEAVVPLGKIKICVIGLGATGGLIAAYLKSKRRLISAVGDIEQKKIIRSDGLKVIEPKGTVLVELDVHDRIKYKPDLVILAVKTKDIIKTIDQNRSFLEDTLILTTQNGIRADQAVSHALGKENIISSLITFGSVDLKPGLINYNLEGDWLIGRPFGPNDDKIKEIAEEISPAFKITVVDNITSMKWMQLIIMTTYCIPYLLGKSIKEAFSDLNMAELGLVILKEGVAVADDAGVALAGLPNFDLDKLKQLISLPSPEAAQIFSQHMVNSSYAYTNYFSEMEYINGEINRLARFGRVGSQLNTKAVNSATKVKKTNKFLTCEEMAQIFSIK